MAQDDTSTRRAFLKGGALLAAPIAAAAGPAALADDPLHARVQRLQDEAAIRELHRSWLQQLNAGGRETLPGHAVRRIIADHAGAPERLEIAADGRSAVGYFDHLAEVETPLPQQCTLAQMAHAQGTGTVCRSERRVLTLDYTKTGGTWRIVKADLTAPV